MSILRRIYSNWELIRDRKFISSIPKVGTELKVLDLGAGDGEFTKKVQKKIETNSMYCIETHKKFVEKLKNYGYKVIEHNLNSYPFPFENNEFDLVISNKVIEHLFYPVKFTKEIHRILKPGGYSIISTENLTSWDNIFALILGQTPFSAEFDDGVYRLGCYLSPHNGEILENSYPSHVRIFSYFGLIDLMKFCKFKVLKMLNI